MLWRRQRTLDRLHAELETIQLFDRVHEYATQAAPADVNAYSLRQVRRSEIIAEINRLDATERERLGRAARISTFVVLLCAVGYATLYYLIK